MRILAYLAMAMALGVSVAVVLTSPPLPSSGQVIQLTIATPSATTSAPTAAPTAATAHVTITYVTPADPDAVWCFDPSDPGLPAGWPQCDDPRFTAPRSPIPIRPIPTSERR